MQALGAYGFRGFFERKPVFLQSVPYALKNIRWLLHNVKLPVELPALTEVFTAMLGSEKLQGFAPEPDKLTVRITSFSFHRGLPKDETGHGGGFVFDARSLPNPGREERYKPLTGKDAPVAEYLEQQESVRQYLAKRDVAGGCQREQLPGARIQEPDGVVWMHGRPAPLGVSGGANGEASARARRGGGAAGIANWRAQADEGDGSGGRTGYAAASLTDERPKALVELNGRTLLEITLSAAARVWRDGSHRQRASLCQDGSGVSRGQAELRDAD